MNTWDNREAVNTDARRLVTSRPVLQETLKATPGAWQLQTLKEELEGHRSAAVSFGHLREKLGIPRTAEMLEVKRHWHRFSPHDAGLKATVNDQVIFRQRHWFVVSSGKYSLILLSLEPRK